MSDVTIIGLGQMGVRLAELFLAADKSVTLWNRTAARAAPLVAAGATLVPSPADAIAASPVTILILSDDGAVDAVLASPGVDGALADRTIVNLGTNSPAATKEYARGIAEAKGRYLDGAIQAAPSQMGAADTPVFLAGPSDVYAAVEPTLRILAGSPVFLGETADAAAYMDLATLSYVYGAYAGFLHGARIAEVTAIDPAVYGKLVNAISPSFGAFFEHQGGVIASGDFTISESPMRISVAAVDRIASTSGELGINRELPELFNGWLRKAADAGLADSELAALIKVLRGGS